MPVLPLWTDGEIRPPTAMPSLMERLLAPFGGWGFRLLGVTALAALYVQRWGPRATTLVLTLTLVEWLLVAAIHPFDSVVGSRVRAHATSGGAARLAVTAGTAMTLAVAISALVCALWWALGGLLVGALTDADADAVVPYTIRAVFGIHLGLLPTAAVALSIADACGAPVRAQLRGALGLSMTVSAFGVVVMGWGPVAWAVLLAVHTCAGLVVAVHVLATHAVAGALKLEREEARVLLRLAGHRDLDVSTSQVPLVVGVISARALVPVSQSLEMTCLCVFTLAMAGWARAMSRRIEPPFSELDHQDDPHRRRWRFRRNIDAATLVATGTLIPLVSLGGPMADAWLRTRADMGPVCVALALWIAVSTTADAARRWLPSIDLGRKQIPVILAETWAVAALSPLCVGPWGWSGVVLLAVAVRAIAAWLSTGRWLALYFHFSLPGLVYGQLWRQLLIGLPALAAALAFALAKPPRSLSEWLVQMFVIAILYLIPGFAGWNLLDTRNDRN